LTKEFNLIGFFCSSLDQTKGLEDLNQTLQNRCDQLQNELIAMRDRYTQSLL
jgi:hypothetical protein